MLVNEQITYQLNSAQQAAIVVHIVNDKILSLNIEKRNPDFYLILSCLEKLVALQNPTEITLFYNDLPSNLKSKIDIFYTALTNHVLLMPQKCSFVRNEIIDTFIRKLIKEQITNFISYCHQCFYEQEDDQRVNKYYEKVRHFQDWLPRYSFANSINQQTSWLCFPKAPL